jgi:DNA-binding MarR family transcriptional regulator
MNTSPNDTGHDTEAETREFEKETLAQIRRTVFAIQSAIRRYVGMSQARGTLFHCMRLDEEMSQAAIQQRLGVDRSEVTRIVKQMEAEGLVTRRPAPADNRFTLVQLTEAGCTLQEEIIAKNQKADATLLQGLSREDMLCTVRTLTRIRENAERLVTDGAAEDTPRSKTKSG